jgi:hypothetical protein
MPKRIELQFVWSTHGGLRKHCRIAFFNAMKLLLYADLQATDGSEVCFHDPSVRLQDWRVRHFFKVLREIYVEHGCDGLVDLGDTTDDRSSIPVPTIDALISSLSEYDGWNMKLIGNHEQYTRDARIHVGKLFSHQFSIVDGVQVFKSPDSDAVFVFAAYPGNYTKLTEELTVITHKYRNSPLVLFGHFQVIGAQLNSGLAYDGVPRELLTRFKAGFLGHVHKPQSIVPGVFYVGSPFQQNFGESYELKRVAVFDTKTLEVTWVPMTDRGFPVYRTITAKEFPLLAKEDSEDRFHVVLKSQADTELFFGHPLCNRAETEYSYTTTNEASAETPKSWSFEAVLSRWIKKNTPKDVGIEISDEEMLDIGTQIANGNA